MNLTQACTHILGQLSDLLQKLTPDEYGKPAVVLNNSTVGQHLRHTLEFFICLEQGASTGFVNYDNRGHDKLIESDKFIATAVINRISEFIQRVDSDQSLVLEATYGMNDDQVIRVNTSMTRELIYNIEHAVHHMAIMKIAIREVAAACELPADFGIAASTIRYAASQTRVSHRS
jgi:uncharacterized damage-inducible protein DinB